jgi:hypothetical protein
LNNEKLTLGMIVDKLLRQLFIAAFPSFGYMRKIVPSEVPKWRYLQVSTYYNVVCKSPRGESRVPSEVLFSPVKVS